MKNAVKEKLAAGKKVIGTFLELGGMPAVECLAISGLDYMIIDCEHGPYDVADAVNFVRAAELKGITPFLRVSDITRPAILKMLDIGAQGLIIPCVETVDQVRQIVEFGKYAPIGKRGFYFNRTADYGYSEDAVTIENLLAVSNDSVMLIPQCETVGCLESIEEIAALEGVDGIFIGPYDLSISMGITGQFQHPDFQQALIRIQKACQAAGIPVFIFAANPDTASAYFARGIEGVAYGTDLAVLIEGYRSVLRQIRR